MVKLRKVETGTIDKAEFRSAFEMRRNFADESLWLFLGHEKRAEMITRRPEMRLQINSTHEHDWCSVMQLILSYLKHIHERTFLCVDVLVTCTNCRMNLTHFIE